MNNCHICGAEIVSKRAKQYCGIACRNKGIAIKRNQSADKNPKWKGGRKLDSTGYVLIKHPSSSRKDGYIQEHIHIIQEHFGRTLHKDEDVHHINNDKTDNRIENLCLIKRSAHMKYHAQLQQRERDEFGRFN